VYGEEKIFGLTRAGKAEQKSLAPARHMSNEPTNTGKGQLSFVLFESPFTKVSTVSRGHPSLVSLVIKVRYCK
jgi:hypothetical protein